MAAILKWMFVLVLLLAVAGGGTAYYFYCRSDEGLRLMVLRQLESSAPTLKFEVARAQLDMIGRVHIYGVTIRLPEEDDDRPTIEIPKIEATLESKPLTDFEEVVIQKLRIINPKVRAVRGVDQKWNLQSIAVKSMSTGPLPEVEIEHGTVSVEFQRLQGPPRHRELQNFNVTMIPADSRRLAIQVATQIAPAGPLSFVVNVNLDGPQWECVSSDPWRIPVDSKLIQLLCDISPEFAENVAKLSKCIEVARTMRSAVTDAPRAEVRDPETPPASSLTVPDLGVRCVCDLTYQFSQKKPGTPLDFQVLVAISDGQITNDVLPLPLHELRGEILADSRQIIVRNIQASNGPMQFGFDGFVVPSKPIQGVMKLRSVEINDELKARLPADLRKIILPLGLTGVCDADLTVTQNGTSWEPEVDLRLTRGTVTEKRFPVTVQNVEGKLHLLKNVVTFSGTGKYANQPVMVEGTVTNPGAAHGAQIILKSSNLPLDDASIDACPLPVQRTIKALNLSGRHDLWLRLTKPAGIGQKYKPELVDKVHHGRMTFQGFPYEIQDLEGFLKWSGEDVEFTNLTGTHDGTKLAGNGTFRKSPGDELLELNITATDGAFDRSLKEALPEKLRHVWNDFHPQGLFDIATRITWVPGHPCDIEIPKILVRDGEVLIRTFPWRLQNLKGEFAYSSRTAKLEIKEFHAQHDDTHIGGQGLGSFPNGAPWRLKFSQLNIDNLKPNLTFRNALPAGMQRVFDVLKPEGDFSFGGPVAFYGPPEGGDAIGAAWNLKAVLSRCALNAGTPINDISGIIQFEGTWDGKRADLDADVNLNTISVFKNSSGKSYQITEIKGPFAFHDDVFVVGTKSSIPPQKSSPDPEQRIRGKVIGGTVYLDAIIDVGAETDYQIFVELEKGLLERYAEQYLRGQSNLAGVMNGGMVLRGKGSNSERMEGEGKLRIAPAALYELPLFVQMFSLPQLRVPDKTAFEQADLTFTVADGRFDFKSIELLGDAMSLRGRGYVRFDGGMELEFGSQPGRGRRRPLQNLFMGAEWIAVRVTGNVGSPNVAYVPLPDLDDAMRQFFNPRMMVPSGRFSPRTGQNNNSQNR